MAEAVPSAPAGQQDAWSSDAQSLRIPAAKSLFFQTDAEAIERQVFFFNTMIKLKCALALAQLIINSHLKEVSVQEFPYSLINEYEFPSSFSGNEPD